MKKYNKIVGTFKRTFKKLEDLNKACSDKSATLFSKIGVLESEGDMAQTTADKLKGIFGYTKDGPLYSLWLLTTRKDNRIHAGSIPVRGTKQKEDIFYVKD